MDAFFADVGLLVVDTPVVVDRLQEPVAAKIVGVDPTSEFYVPKGRLNKGSLPHVRL